MARMVRKQIVLDPAQESALASLAAERGVSQSELIRRAIDALLEHEGCEVAKDRAWDELLDWFETPRYLGLTDEHGNRNWTREDLYDFRGFPRHERDRLRDESRRRKAP
jgi:Arc/MetJ-type ribon-helix-helix transcriptional regulator